jgi:hypothetical protein
MKKTVNKQAVKKQGCVYFFQIAKIAKGVSSPVKIGFTRYSPRTRCRDIEMYLPWKLNFLGAFCCASPEREETALKRRLAAYRIKGEWFEAAAALRELKGMATRLPPCGFDQSCSAQEGSEDRLLIRIPTALKEGIKRRAKRNGTSIARTVISDIENWLANNPE